MRHLRRPGRRRRRRAVEPSSCAENPLHRSAVGEDCPLKPQLIPDPINSLQFFSGMRTLVTGGTGKLGSAVAARLQRAGWDVVAVGRADGDLSTVEGARTVVRTAVEQLGGLDRIAHAACEG